MTEKRLPTLQPPHPAENVTLEQAIWAARKVKEDQERKAARAKQRLDVPVDGSGEDSA